MSTFTLLKFMCPCCRQQGAGLLGDVASSSLGINKKNFGATDKNGDKGKSGKGGNKKNNNNNRRDSKSSQASKSSKSSNKRSSKK